MNEVRIVDATLRNGDISLRTYGMTTGIRIGRRLNQRAECRGRRPAVEGFSDPSLLDREVRHV